MVGMAAATSGKLREGLAAVRALRRLVDEMEALQVDRARELGWAWGDIAEPLGISRQSAHKKHTRRRAKTPHPASRPGAGSDGTSEEAPRKGDGRSGHIQRSD
ncbi:hypothetical protein Z951_36090 [Streptomyces sp. PRh5]|nr:hypothetical protein Z951_36090 [Streptomyces sp. PRh5]